MQHSINKNHQTLSTLSESATMILVKIRMQCKQPELADDVKDLFDKLLAYSNIVDHRSNSEFKHLDETIESSKHTPTLPDLISKLKSLREIDPDLFEYFAKVTGDVSSLSIPQPTANNDSEVDYNAEKPIKGSWAAIKRDHFSTLAMLRAYRFLVNASSSELASKGFTRETLMMKIRALEISSSMRGVAF
jgi:hypothetical protein